MVWVILEAVRITDESVSSDFPSAFVNEISPTMG